MTNDESIDYKYISSSLMEAIPLPVFVVDQALTIQHCNQAALHMFAPTDQHPALLQQVVHDTAILQFISLAVSTHTRQQELFSKTQTDIAWKVSIAPLNHQPPVQTPGSFQGSPSVFLYFAVIIEDISEARRLEHVQRDFLANISHELRTPLTSVRLLAETLEDTIDTDPDKAQEFVEKIENEVQHLTELVSEILDLSHIESGQLIMSIEPIAAERLVREIMARMLPLAQRYRVKLVTDISQGHTLVAADSKHIMRALVNLVHNAIKFTPSAGKIVIGTNLLADQNMQRFFVRDTGVGIRSEDLPRVFERFYKTDRARSKTGFVGPGGGGTGLGLAIARHVVEAHGGRIMAASIPGEGSTFMFTLPVAIDTPRAPNQPAQSHDPE